MIGILAELPLQAMLVMMILMKGGSSLGSSNDAIYSALRQDRGGVHVPARCNAPDRKRPSRVVSPQREANAMVLTYDQRGCRTFRFAQNLIAPG